MARARFGVGRFGWLRFGAGQGGIALPTANPTAGRVRLYVRDASRMRVAEIDDYRELRLTLRMNAVGSWSLTVPAGGVVAPLLVADGAGIIVARDNATLLSGPVRTRERRWAGDEDVLTAGGPDDLCWLADRLALPVPSGPPYTAASHDVRTGAAETVCGAYVAANAGANAPSARRVTGLVLAPDQGRGATVIGRARFVNLLELLQELALAAGDHGFRLVQQGTDLQWEWYVPVDRAATALFSPLLGNLRGYSYRSEAARSNYVIVAGGEEGVNRVFVEGGDAASIAAHGRIESIRDRRDTTDPTELAQTRDAELAAAAAVTHLELQPIDTAGLAFGVDYQLGDRVTVVVDGVPLTDSIRTVELALTSDAGEQITPTVGTPALPEPGLFGLVQRLAATDSRLSRLERR